MNFPRSLEISKLLHHYGFIKTLPILPTLPGKKVMGLFLLAIPHWNKCTDIFKIRHNIMRQCHLKTNISNYCDYTMLNMMNALCSVDSRMPIAATAALYILLDTPTFHFRPAGLSLHAGLPTLIATAINKSNLSGGITSMNPLRHSISSPKTVPNFLRSYVKQMLS